MKTQNFLLTDNSENGLVSRLLAEKRVVSLYFWERIMTQVSRRVTFKATERTISLEHPRVSRTGLRYTAAAGFLSCRTTAGHRHLNRLSFPEEERGKDWFPTGVLPESFEQTKKY